MSFLIWHWSSSRELYERLACLSYHFEALATENCSKTVGEYENITSVIEKINKFIIYPRNLPVQFALKENVN